MSKKKQEATPEESNLLVGMAEAAKAKFGNGVVTYMGDEIKELVVGIPLPALSLMFLLDSTVFPLGKSVGFAGFPQSNKSAFLFELMRWFHGCGGYGKIEECEGGKVSPTLLHSIVGDSGYKRVMIDQCGSIDDARQRINATIDYLRKKDPKKTIPFLIGLDSATGSTTEENCKKLMGSEEWSGRGFPVNALFYTEYLKVLSGELAGWPYTFVFTNHLKQKPSAMPGLPPTKTMPGGAALMFHASVVLWMERIKVERKFTRMENGRAISCPTEIRKIKLECHKNSLGTDARAITTDFMWWYDDNNIQVSKFDWDASTAELLFSMQATESKELKQFKGAAMLKGGLEEIVDITVTNQRYSSTRLGVSGVSDSEFGAAVHADAKLMNELIDFLHIKRHPVLSSVGMAVTEAKEARGKKNAEKAKEVTGKVVEEAAPAEAPAEALPAPTPTDL